ncbi:MAG: VUT family protein, partial [Gemmatimonadota bacterium]|nr:VUT family protein [Gemmatimonadota bacterium]
ILYATGGLGAEIDTLPELFALMASSYAFKFCFALFDTPFFYLGVYVLRRKVGIVPEAVEEV